VEALIVDVENFPNKPHCVEVGFRAGARIKVLASGEPSCVLLNGARLAVSKQLLEHITVAYYR